jgi:CRISPR-associated protein Csc3
MSDMIDFPPEDDVAFDEDVAAALNEPVEVFAKVEIAAEPLFSLLLKGAIDQSDVVLRDYAEHVAPRLSQYLGHVAAKGGKFVRDRLNDGKTAEEVARYGDDQTMRAHIVNGLLPTAQIARTLKQWDVRRFQKEFDEGTYRLFCAGYTLRRCRRRAFNITR